MKSWDDNNKSFEMLPELHITGFRRQWAAAWLNVAPSCQGETHPTEGKQINKEAQGTHRAEALGGEGFNLDTISVYP